MFLLKKTDTLLMRFRMLSIMPLQVIRETASQIQSAPYFIMMIDEAMDLANIEQVVLVIRSVNDNLTVMKISWFIYN